MKVVKRIWALIRNTWRTLTSMGTALVLLFLLALAAIPGALLPQRSLNAAKVDEYLVEHPTIGPGWTGCRASTSSPASGSPPSTCCCSSPWSGA